MARVRPAVTVVDTDARRRRRRRVPRGRPHRGAHGRWATPPGAAPRGCVTLDAGDPVAIVWTSGSTGVPKGAVFDHAQPRAPWPPAPTCCRTPGTAGLSPLPFPHVGYMTRAWDEIAHGVTTVITPQPWTARHPPSNCSSRERVTVGQGVPTQWALMLAHPDFAGADVSHLRIAGTGASPGCRPSWSDAMRERLGCPVVVRYTSTESSLGTGTRPEDPDEVVATTVGRPVPGVELEVVDDDGQRRSPPGTWGGCGCVRRRSLRGYVGDLAAGDAHRRRRHRRGARRRRVGHHRRSRRVGTTATSGWWVGCRRCTSAAGYNVYPAEVEAVLGELPGCGAGGGGGGARPRPGRDRGGVRRPRRRGVPAPELDDLRAACAPHAWPTTRRPTASYWSTNCR